MFVDSKSLAGMFLSIRMSANAAAGFSTLLAVTLTGRVMFNTMMQLAQIPFHDRSERNRNYKLGGILIAYFIGIVPLAYERQVEMSILYGAFIGIACWREFRKLGNKLCDRWTMQMCAPAVRLRTESIICHLQRTINFVMRCLYAFILASLTGNFSWYYGRVQGNHVLLNEVRAASDVIELIVLMAVVLALVFIISVIVGYHIEIRSRLKVIANMVHTNGPVGHGWETQPARSDLTGAVALAFFVTDSRSNFTNSQGDLVESIGSPVPTKPEEHMYCI
jgi:hypothetical protein